MRIWLFNVGEPLPLPPYQNRVWRMGMLARLLVSRGHEVLWWSSDWNHSGKKPYFGKETRLRVKDGYEFLLMRTCGYKSNISLRRILDHMQLAREFSRLSRTEPVPDAMLVNYPTVELCDAALAYAKEKKVPFVVDVRDQWPDLFYDVSPAPLRPFVRLACSYMERAAKRIFAGADAVTGNAPSAVAWALGKAGRKASSLDKAFGMAYDAAAPGESEVEAGLAFWERLGLAPEKGEFIVVYTGVVNLLTRDLATIVRAAGLLRDSHPGIKFVICGAGDDLEKLRGMAGNAANLILPGWIGAGEIYSLLRMASLGVNPSKGIRNFEGGITNKPVEYLSAGLPVLTTVKKGIMWDYLRSEECGLGYADGDERGLADIIARLYSDSSAYGKMRAKARELYSREFTPEKIYGEMAGLVEAIGAAGAGKRRPGENNA